MRALRYYGPKDVRLEYDVPEPKCAPHQVKIRPAYVGICGTDLHEYQSRTLIPGPDHPHPLTGERLPITLGHEFSGVVVEIGSAVNGKQMTLPPLSSPSPLCLGDRVVVRPTIYCGECDSCLEGWTNCCSQLGFVGISGRGGGLSDYVCVDMDAVFKLPVCVSLKVGALVEPLAVAWHAVSKSGIRPGETVLVVGTGPIGLAVIQCIRAREAGSTIIAIEVAAERRAFAQRLGANIVLDPTGTDDMVEKVRALTYGHRGPAVAFDCAGVAASLDTATRAVRDRGTIVNAAIWHRPVAFHPNNIIFHEKILMGSLCFVASDFAQVIDCLERGELKPECMITSNIPIDNSVEGGFETLIKDKDRHVKILVDMTIL